MHEYIRVIGIDPGSRKTGIGIIDYNSLKGSIKPVFIKTIRLNLESSISERLAELFQCLTIILKEYNPDSAAVEDVFVGKNSRSSLILGHARGVVLATLGLVKIPITHIVPRNIKKGLTGNSLARKIQVADMVQTFLKLKKKPPEDAADALAVAILSVKTNFIC